MNRLHILITAFLAIPFSALSDTPNYCKPTFDNGADVYFSSSLDKAKIALSDICNALSNGGITEIELNNSLVSFHQKLQQEAVIKMPQLANYLSIFNSPLLEVQGDIATGMIPEFRPSYPDPMNPNQVDKITFYMQGKAAPKIEVVPNPEAQSCYDNDDCRKALIAYMDILKDVYNPLSMPSLIESYKFLTLKDKEWSTFIEEARGQTFIDIAVTSWLYEWKYAESKHDFQSPPRVQWFALRPNLLIENVSDAVDGNQLKESLALEVIGFNYWEDACFGYACGASLIVNYADRNGIEDEGWGLMFHADNSYSFGVTKYGDETGFFVTVDLLKLFKDKKASIEDYRDKYRSMSN